MLIKTLKWPVIQFMVEAILTDLKNIFLPPVVAPILPAFGIMKLMKARTFKSGKVVPHYST